MPISIVLQFLEAFFICSCCTFPFNTSFPMHVILINCPEFSSSLVSLAVISRSS